MHHRDRVIKGIERLKTMKPGDHRAESLRSLMDKLSRRSERKFDRNPWILIASTVLVLPTIVVIGSTTGRHGTEVLPYWIVFLGVFGGLIAVAWIWTRLPKKMGLQVVRINGECHSCSFGLEGHASMLGDDIWVGPEVCPECGERYPAIA
jgi:hypothetical protein